MHTTTLAQLTCYMDHHDKHIVLMTATGQENLWDELILLQEVTLLLSHFPQAGITIFTHDIILTKSFLSAQGVDIDDISFQDYFPNNIRRDPIKNIFLFFQSVRVIVRCDVVIIGGGGLIYDETSEWGGGTSPVFLWRLRVAIARFFRKKVVYWSLGVSTKKKVGKLFHSQDIITVRDAKSHSILEQKSILSDIMPDPVFLLQREKKDVTNIQTIGLALRRKGVHVHALTNLVSDLKHKWYDIVGIPHSYHPTEPELDDRVFMESVGIPCLDTTHTSLDAYHSVDAIITNRFHGVILWIIHGLPTLPIAVNEKITQLSDQLGIIPIESLDQVSDIGEFLTATFRPQVTHEKILWEAVRKTKQFILDPLCDLL